MQINNTHWRTINIIFQRFELLHRVHFQLEPIGLRNVNKFTRVYSFRGAKGNAVNKFPWIMNGILFRILLSPNMYIYVCFLIGMKRVK